MKDLTLKEVNEVRGGIWGFVIGSLVNLTVYAIKKHHNHEPVTVGGAATAASFGAVTGGVGGLAAGAAGRGIVANIVWRPGFTAINAAGQGIAAKQ